MQAFTEVKDILLAFAQEHTKDEHEKGFNDSAYKMGENISEYFCYGIQNFIEGGKRSAKKR